VLADTRYKNITHLNHDPIPMIKLVLCGPPHSGKSCFKNGLITYLKQMASSPYPYQINACPDGEGSWFHETAQVDPALAARERQKKPFTEEEAQKFVTWVRDVKEPITIVDVGGKISPENRQIMSHATHAVILSGDRDAFAPWETFCQELGLGVVGKIYSDYHGTEDVVEWRSGVLTGSVHHLDRTVSAMDRPMIQALAGHIIKLVNDHGINTENDVGRSV
jgi:CRISPR-associated protein Csx3